MSSNGLCNTPCLQTQRGMFIYAKTPAFIPLSETGAAKSIVHFIKTLKQRHQSKPTIPHIGSLSEHLARDVGYEPQARQNSYSPLMGTHHLRL